MKEGVAGESSVEQMASTSLLPKRQRTPIVR